MKSITETFYTIPEYEWDLITDEAKCSWCGNDLRKTVIMGRLEVIYCKQPTCLAMAELRK